MSWNIHKIGTRRDALKAAVQAVSICPQSVRDELCRRIDSYKILSTDVPDPLRNELPPGHAMLVESHGHLNDTPETFWQGMEDKFGQKLGVEEITLRVRVIPLIDTPL